MPRPESISQPNITLTAGSDVKLAPTSALQTEITFAPSGANIYPLKTEPISDTYVEPDIKLGRGADPGEEALRYVSEIFPDSRLSVLSTEGVSAVVLQDDEGRAYKVHKTPDMYSNVEEEVAILSMLSAEGLAPKPLLLVDAALQYRTDGSLRGPKRFFADIKIPRQEGVGPFPITVMDKVNEAPIEQAPLERVLDSFEKLAALTIKEGLVFHDIEPVYDLDDQTVKLLDCDGIGRVSVDKERFYESQSGLLDLYSDMTDEQLARAKSLRSLAVYFIRNKEFWPSIQEVNAILEEKGVRGISELVQKALST